MNIVTTTDPEVVARYIADRLISHLEKREKVLWFIPGGSAIAVAVQASQMIRTSGVPYQDLTVTLTDERYGPVGHADSNWKQLIDAGFSLPDAHILPVLTSTAGTVSREVVAKVWSASLSEALDSAKYILGFFGIGADGHIAGILPYTSSVDSKELVDSYATEKFERITITSRVIEKMSEHVAFAVGEGKWSALRRLAHEDLSIVEQPAQLLKKLGKFILFTDSPL